jgi:hypothetical protein
MAQERALFTRMVAREDGACEAEADEEGTVELFAIDPGLEQP